jgi:SOS-response transcriptional repressor LexA
MSEKSNNPTGVSVHAGFPNPAADKNLSSLDLNQLLIQHVHSTFLFRIRGQEWESLGIFDEDVAVVDRAIDARKSDLVVWWSEGGDEFAISSYKVMPASANVWGVITSVIHQFRKGLR